MLLYVRVAFKRRGHMSANARSVVADQSHNGRKQELIGQMRKTAQPTVVSVTSSAAIDALPELLDDLTWKKTKYDKRQAYCLSKACCVLFSDYLGLVFLIFSSGSPETCRPLTIGSRSELKCRGAGRDGARGRGIGLVID